MATFLVANWPAIIAFLRNEQQRLLFDGSAPPKEEEEQVQLNIALQREIVNFTALGIQRSVRDMDLFQKRDTRSISSRYSSLNIFVSSSFARLLFFSIAIKLGYMHGFIWIYVECENAWRICVLYGG